jgi:hypothetical protein
MPDRPLQGGRALLFPSALNYATFCAGTASQEQSLRVSSSMPRLEKGLQMLEKSL